MTVREFFDSFDTSGVNSGEAAFVSRASAVASDLSLLILEALYNSIEASAKNIFLQITETDEEFFVTLRDDGRGIPEEYIKRAVYASYTSKTVRSIGLGLTLFNLAALQTGGSFNIKSSTGISHGTTIEAVFFKTSRLCPKIGDMPSSVMAAVGAFKGTELGFRHVTPDGEVAFSTKDIIDELSGSVLLSAYTLKLVRDELVGQYEQLKK